MLGIRFARLLPGIREQWPELLFACLLSLGIVTDLALVFSGHQSISLSVWHAEKQHPTLISLGMLLAVGACYLLRRCWVAVMVCGFLCGHLFIHY